MPRDLIILLSLFILCSSTYRPMEKKSKYGDDICRYEDGNYYYVKPCEKGKYCLEKDADGSDLYICQDLPETREGLKTLDEECSSDFDCENNLECIGGHCKSDCGNQYTVKNDQGSYVCRDSNHKATDGICKLDEYSKDSSGTVTGPDTKYGIPTGKSQICGLYSNFYDYNNQDYELSEIKYAYVGSVDNGNYVKNEILCKSGFALFYYPKGNLKNPYSGTGSSTHNKMYKMCVTPIAIDHYDPLLSSQKSSAPSPSQESCVIYYKEKDEDTTIKKYNIDQLSLSEIYSEYTNSYSTINELQEEFCSFTDYEFKIKFQQFKEYTTNLKEEEREKCGLLDGSNTKYGRYSCDNNDLIKSWYFYKNPKNYLVYSKREKLEVVLNYLIQKEYPSYEFNQILNINYFLILLFILFL